MLICHVWCVALGRFCEAIAHFHANAPDDSKLQLSQDAFQVRARGMISR